MAYPVDPTTSWVGPWVAVTRAVSATADADPAGIVVDHVEIGIDRTVPAPVMATRAVGARYAGR